MFSKKWMLSTFIVVALFAVLVQFFFQSRFVSQKIKDRVESELEQILQQEVSIGHVEISLLSSAFTIKEIVIQSDSAAPSSSISAKEIHIVFSPVSFFTETLLIRKITIDSPSLFLNAQSHLDLIPNFSNTKAATAKTEKAPPVSVMIRSIRLKSGSVNYQGNEMLKTFSLLNINAEVRPNFAMNQFEIDLISEGGQYLLEKLSGDLFQLESKILIQPEKLVLKRALLVSSHGRLLTKGSVKLKGDNPFDLQLNLSLPLENIVSTILKEEGFSIFNEKQISGMLQFAGHLRGSTPNFSIRGDVQVPKLQLAGESVASVEAELHYQAGAISIPDFSGTLFSGAFDGAAEININPIISGSKDRKTTPLFVVALKLQKLPLAKVAHLASKKDKNTADALSGIIASGDLVVSDMGLHEAQFQGRGQLSLTRQNHLAPIVLKNAAPLVHLSDLFTKGALQWHFNRGRLVLDQGELFFPDTEIRFDGSWQETKGLALNTALKSTKIETLAARMDIPLTGRLSLSGVLTGQFTEKDPLPEFKGTINLENWTILNQAFATLNADLAVQGRQIHFKQGLLKGRVRTLIGQQWVPPSDVLFEGELHLDNLTSPYFNFQTRLKAGNAQEVFGFFDLDIPLYTRAKGNLKIAGRPEDFSVAGQLSLSKGWLYGERFDAGRLDLTVSHEKVVLREVELQRGESRLTGAGEIGYEEDFSLAITGNKLHLQETGFLKQVLPELEGDIALSVTGGGTFDRPILKFRSQFESLRYHEINMLKGNIRADWIGKKVHFDASFPLRQLHISGGIDLSPDYPFSFHSQFSKLKIDQLLKNHLTGPAQDVALLATGKLNGTGQLSHLDTLSFSAQLSELSADFANYQLKNNGPLKLRAKNGVLLLNQASFKGENTALILNGSLSFLKRWDLFIKGEADLALLSYFSKTISSGSGKARLDLSITDNWARPRFRGQLTLNDGKIRVAHFSQSLQIASLTALFNEEQLVLENMSGRLGGGQFQLVGKATLSGFGFSAFGLFLSLDHTRVMLAADLPATLSGELFFQRQDNQQVLKGDLQIQRLIYNKQINLKTLIGDLRETGAETLPPENDLFGKTRLNIHFLGAQGLRIENNIAKVPLNVDLLLKGNFGNPLLIGRIDVPKGEVFFLKNTFRVLSGSVDFLNPKKIDPTFNMEATTEVRNVVTDRNYKVDLGLSGTISQVTLNFNSFPSLPKDDILALLAIGKTTEDLDQVKGGASTEAGNLAVSEFFSQSVNELTGIVGDPLEELTGTRLKIDPYISGTDSRTTTGTRLTAEKRLLKDQLVVIYSTTLDPNEEDLIKMVYDISKNLSLIGNRDDSGQLGGDLRFRFEFR